MFSIKRILPVIAFMIAGIFSAMGATSKATPSEKSKMVYANSLDEAKGLSIKTGKPVFVNCYAAWAGPCIAMDERVFSDQEFANFMNKNFINVFLDVKSPEGKEFIEKYGINTFAYFIIIDGYGNVIQPIDRGGRLPEFKERVELGLRPTTSLTGTRKKIESGKYSKKDLYNYLRAVNAAGEGKEYKKMINIYAGMLTPKEFLDTKNWNVLKFNRDRNSGFYKSVVANKAEFEKKIGSNEVNDYLAKCFSKEVLRNATGDSELDDVKSLDAELAAAALPDTSVIMLVHKAGMLRAQHRFLDLLKYMDENGEAIDKEPRLRRTIECSFNFNSLKGDDRNALKEYLLRASKREGGRAGAQLQELALSLDKAPAGVDFLHDVSFNEALEMAKKEGKYLFVDCYTSWCGPCRALAANVFPREDVGECYNKRFVNLKIDMERGEGPELAARYGVAAYPTMLFINSEGNVISKLVGYKTPEALIKEAKELKQ